MKRLISIQKDVKPVESEGFMADFLGAFSDLRGFFASENLPDQVIQNLMTDITSTDDLIAQGPQIKSKLRVIKSMLCNDTDFTPEQQKYIATFRKQEEAMTDIFHRVNELEKEDKSSWETFETTPTPETFVKLVQHLEKIYSLLMHSANIIPIFLAQNKEIINTFPEPAKSICLRLSTHHADLRKHHIGHLFVTAFLSRHDRLTEQMQSDPPSYATHFTRYLLMMSHLSLKVAPLTKGEYHPVGELVGQLMGVCMHHSVDIQPVMMDILGRLKGSHHEIFGPRLPGAPTIETMEGLLATSHGTTKAGLGALSTFSSEVDYTQIPVADRVLTVQDFDQLPESGTLNPYRLRLAQGGINSTFRDNRPLSTLVDALVGNPNYREDVPEIEIGIYQGKVWSFDTRRAVCFMMAREQNPLVTIRYTKIDGDYLEERIRRIFSARPWNGHVTAIRYGGKGSPSTPYIPPPLRPQLQESVDKSFKPYPNARVADSDDPNGFPVNKKQAQKIFDFLKQGARSSSYKRLVLKSAKKIKDTKGEEAMFQFLIDKKSSIIQRHKLRQDTFE